MQNSKIKDKIIGHSSSILPTLLINPKGQFDHEIAKLLIGYNQNGCKLNITYSVFNLKTIQIQIELI